jgi:hypothetical protein
LTRSFDKHLDSDDLDALVASTVDAVGGGRFSEQALDEAKRHVEACLECRQKVQMHKSAQSDLSRLGVPGEFAGPDCIPESEWVEVVAGITPPEKAKDLLKHAAHCGRDGG